MSKNILITGGAGFIGSHLCDELLQHGYNVRVLDNLVEQVHGNNGSRQVHLHDVEFIHGDVRDSRIVEHALKGMDAVFHFAACVGVGQSMYQIRKYTDVNNMGTAVLLECLMRRPVARLVVASSMSIYGEGLYAAADGTLHEDAGRTMRQLKAGDWELKGRSGEPLFPLPTPETKKPSLASIYALSKYDQEVMCLLCGKAYGIPTVALRLFNVYGTRQSLSNPYTGVLAIFASRLLNDNPPLIFEDGLQRRDFVNVLDVARACRLALETTEVDHDVFNIGSGQSYTILDIAQRMCDLLDKPDIKPSTNGKYRVGDIRNCFADISKARKILKYQPEVSLEEGLEELSAWLDPQLAVDRVEYAGIELAARGLTI
ncbi:dTDP-L-rhamnose 4-epimerase [Desulfonatronum thiosulfatophilum]|uniref:dTDP-L-rhamnose 4-epimerase n=1 Tax=Desulfonatronum thiosulfatophilum TaxID=617002 RepID=A0A1G6BCD4_9BACT|nr:SDR family NAD(P)-dependent oxidoreductase [Desulfonatronum thiosulfatophilum]SDB18264.1 dTDP-L-rhamnose 4-epimerase [Desulfonatronum thiosulfatophilum]